MIGDTKRALGWIICTFVVAAFLGCAVPQSNTDTGAAIYQPRPQPGVSFDTAKKDLTEILGGGPGPVGVRYYGRPGINDEARGAELKELIRGGSYIRLYGAGPEIVYVLFSSIPVLKDGIQVSPRLFFPFIDLLDRPASVIKTPYPHSYMVHLGPVSFLFEDLAQAQRFSDSMASIQQSFKKFDDVMNGERLARFESAAAQYRSLRVKPPASEEQRKMIVRANLMNQRKEYVEALDLYLKAVELDAVSYPPAYFNMALLSAQLGRYKPAIAYMKQYLLLEPEAKDARSAQDKIYEWEFLLERKKQ